MKNRMDQVSLRLVREKTFYTSKELNDAEKIANEIGRRFCDYDREQMIIINLDTAMHLINFQVSSIGTQNNSMASAGELIKVSLLSNASNVILMHNHPSGDVHPSASDVEATKRIKDAFGLFDINVIDHIIISPHGEFYSMYDEGLMP